MKLYSYVVARDFGFAPNPFFGFCTLATCKPKIRKYAVIDDWIVGTGAKSKYSLQGHLIYAMKVNEVLNFNEYWNDPRFALKKPDLAGTLVRLYGDNIYHREGEHWNQSDSHHSLDNGVLNSVNLKWDTSVDRLLIATKFVYWGKDAPLIPAKFRAFSDDRIDICVGRGHRSNFPQDLPEAFAEWLDEQGKWGVQGEPIEFKKHKCSVLITKNI